MMKQFTDFSLQVLVQKVLVFSFLLSLFLFTAPNTLSPAYAVCSCAPNADYGDSSDKSAWCACAQSCGDSGSVNNGPPGQGSCVSSAPTTCAQGVCGACATKNTCGNTTYDTCDTSPCTAAGATANTTFRCWASANQSSCSFSENRCGSCAPSATACTANRFEANNCRRCNSDGSAWSTDYGNFDSGEVTKAQWCGCAQQKGDTGSFARGPKADGSAACTTTTTPTTDDRSECSYKFLETATRQKAAYLISQKEYILEVIMKNTSPVSTWKPATYKLAFEKNKEDWNGSDQALTEEISPGESKTFDIRVKAPATTNNEAKKAEFFIRMQNSGSGFGAACEPDDVNITPPFSGTGPISTLCYVISEDLAEVNRITKCDFNDPLVRPYTQNPQTLNYIYKDTTPGLKNLYVKFFDNNNKPSNEGIPYTKTVLLSPIPRITTIDCKFTPNEIGTTITINGENFATQGRGTVKVGDQQSQIVSWNNTAINATVGQRLETSARVSVTFDDGKTLSDTCLVNTTTFTFTAKNQCAKDNDFSASNVDVRIYENGTDPIIKQVIKLDKEGKPTGFAPKLEKGKKYTMIIKSPGTLAKKVEVNTGSGGTTIVDPFAVNVGDIYPRNTMDGKVNNLDVSELKRQWSPTKDTQASGDLNSDSRVNNVDYSCMRININKEDEAFTPSPVNNTGTGSASGTRSFGVKGKVFIDTDQDGAQDVSEPSIPGVTVKALRQSPPEVPGQSLTSAQAAQAILLGQTVTDSSGNYSINLVPPSSILNLVMWVDPSALSGQGGQSAIGIGAFTDDFFKQFPLVLDLKLKP